MYTCKNKEFHANVEVCIPLTGTVAVLSQHFGHLVNVWVRVLACLFIVTDDGIANVPGYSQRIFLGCALATVLEVVGSGFCSLLPMIISLSTMFVQDINCMRQMCFYFDIIWVAADGASVLRGLPYSGSIRIYSKFESRTSLPLTWG